jgi:hypothetical protein
VFVAPKWTPESEKLLLETHKAVDTSKNVGHKWKKVSAELLKFGHDFSSEKCRLRVKSLKEKYERKKKKNNKSGESPASSDDEVGLEDIFADTFDTMPDMKPKSVIESMKRQHSQSPITVADEGESDAANASGEDEPTPSDEEKPSTSKKAKATKKGIF